MNTHQIAAKLNILKQISIDGNGKIYLGDAPNQVIASIEITKQINDLITAQNTARINALSKLAALGLTAAEIAEMIR